MEATSRRWQLAGFTLLTLACMGCNPLALGYFLAMGMDPKYDPEFKLASDDKKEMTKVVVLVSTPLAELRPELHAADKELTLLFAQKLQEACKRNKENVIIASTSKVQKFKDEHPMWQSLSLEEVGKQLDTHYVLDMEINHLSLYENGSQRTFYRGNAAISVTVVDVRKIGENPVFRKEYVTEYPRSSGPVLASETNAQKFRRDFLTRVAIDLTWYFTAHPTNEHYTCE